MLRKIRFDWVKLMPPKPYEVAIQAEAVCGEDGAPVKLDNGRTKTRVKEVVQLYNEDDPAHKAIYAAELEQWTKKRERHPSNVTGV